MLCLVCWAHRQQDAHLEDIEAAVTRLGRVGLTIHEELATQGNMLDELDEDVDTTHSRLRATQKKVPLLVHIQCLCMISVCALCDQLAGRNTAGCRLR
jgi:hypothetical protein